MVMAKVDRREGLPLASLRTRWGLEDGASMESGASDDEEGTGDILADPGVE